MILQTLYVSNSWTSSCFFEDLENCSISQVGKVLPECGWSKPLMGEILKDTPCYHSRTELRTIAWNLQSFLTIQTDFVTFEKFSSFQKSQRRLCIVLSFWCNKAKLKVKFWRCYHWVNTLIWVEFWNQESFRDIKPLSCSKPLYFSSWRSSN